MATDLVKSYTRYDFGLSSTSITNVDEQNRDIMYQIKDNLVTNCGATVISSSDSSTADASDNWSVNTDLVWATAGNPHSWIVLQFGSIATGYQVCIDLNVGSTTTESCSIILSVAGFAGGSTTARPTATDEYVLVNSTYWGASSSASITRQYSIIKASDNSVIYIVGFITGSPVCFWIIGKAINGPSSHTTPAYMYVISTTPTIAGISTASAIPTFIDGESSVCYVGRPYSGLDVTANASYYRAAFDIDGNITMWGHSFISNNPSRPGSYGYLPDLYWVNAGHSDLNYIYQSDGTTLGWVIFGDLAVPCGPTVIPR